MDFLRELVSGPKNRYRQQGFNLDLTYITPRIIAMAYPAQGLESLYRNSIDTVSQLLDKNHHNHYQIINVSGRQINGEKLANIHSFYWQDHKTPELQTLFIICQIMLQYLGQCEENVCVVHCNHGKGRTGTLICCFMIFAGFFDQAEKSMKYYEEMRFEKEGYGVTQPCQIQYIHYFSQIIKMQKMLPQPLSLTKIELKGSHSLKYPYFKLRSVEHNDFYLNTKDEQMQILEIQKQDEFIVKIRKNVYFLGDCVVQIKNQGIGKRVMGNYAFNTAFIGNNAKGNSGYKYIQVQLNQLSPLSAVKSGIFGKDFRLCLTFKKLCNCEKMFDYEKRCSKCKPLLLIQKKKWQLIYQILQRRGKINGKWLLFGNKQYSYSQYDQNEKEYQSQTNANITQNKIIKTLYSLNSQQKPKSL